MSVIHGSRPDFSLLTPAPVSAPALVPASSVPVALDVPLRRSFDYRLPPGDAWPLAGSRVAVSFAGRQAWGITLADPAPVVDESGKAFRLKDLTAIPDDQPLLDEDTLALVRFASDYYLHPIGEVVAAALPLVLREKGPPAMAGWQRFVLTDTGHARMAAGPGKGRNLHALLVAVDGTGPGGADADTLRAAGHATATWKRVRAEGWVAVIADRAPSIASAALLAKPGPVLTAEQTAALAAMMPALAAGAGYSAHLLQGVTGSGKTELYLRLVANALEQGHQVLALAPEIGLVPQLATRLAERFGTENVGIFHSAAGDPERARVWARARAGDLPIVVGTRSAVFLPLARPGLVIVDEEHDASYKQHEGFRYHAVDLALWRAHRWGVPIVLGSATPRLETLAKALAGKIAHVRLRHRVTNIPPPIPKMLDIRSQPLVGGMSRPLFGAIGQHLADGGQAMVFLNRRGFAPVWMCHDCGLTLHCPLCDAHFTYHRFSARLVCHHCGSEERVPRECASCGGVNFDAVGEGTERIEETLRQRFPDARTERLDADRARRAGVLAETLDGLRENRIQLITGTQMLAKGHDFPNLSLVGVLGVDQALYSPDFRATERLGQLLVQVAGRAGRAERAGEVWVQTHAPDHPVLQTLLTEGYDTLAEGLLAERELGGLPPYGFLAIVRAESEEEGAALAFLNGTVFDDEAGVTLLGPAPDSMEKRAGKWRAHLWVQADTRGPLRTWLRRFIAAREAKEGRAPKGVRWVIDIDPQDTH